jgi:hypothetical protein
MYIYVGNLPGKATLVELQSFLGDHEMSVDFSAHSHPNNTDHHFVLVKTAGKRESKQLIRELDGRCFKGSPVQARLYVERAATSDWKGPERRFQQLDLDLIFKHCQ